MTFSKLDTIVRGILMNKGYTMHWYLQYLKYACDCLLELASDDLRIVNQSTLTLTSYFAAPIPAGYIDWVTVGIPNGQYVKPMTQVETLNREYNYDSNGNPQPWPQVQQGLTDLSYYGVPYLTYYMNSFNNRGENIGGLYGYRTDGSPFIFQVMEERNEIQFDSGLGYSKIILVWVSDGRSASAASRIPVYAEKTIRDYCDWQKAENDRNVGSGEKQRLYNMYVGSRVVLRGRMNPLTADDIMASFRNNYTATIKT